jgi:hypothetical protein
MGRRYETDEWLEFATGNDDLSDEAKQRQQEFELAIEEAADAFLLSQGYLGSGSEGEQLDALERDFDFDGLPYLAFQSLQGAGVGLWEGEEEWHEGFEKVVLKDKDLSSMAEELEQLAQENLPPSDEDMEEAAVISYARGGGYQASFWGGEVGDFDSISKALDALKKEMDAVNYFPSIYIVNDRGNIDLVDLEGKVLGSWV